MAAKTSYIPRFLLPQYGPMWRTAFARPLNTEAGQVMVRYASQTAYRRPSASAMTRAATQRTASTKSAASNAVKNSAPTKPPSKTAARTSAPNTPSPSDATSSTTTTSRTAPARATAPKPAPAADPSKPIVLEKPERFNPPSHGARLPRSTPRHYGGSPTAEEIRVQTQRSYPGLPPPPKTWSHWFINNRTIHMLITLGTLLSLAMYTFAMNFKAKSPFADMIPPISEFPRHPFQYIGVCIDVMRLHEEYESALTAEKRRRKVDDVAKRNEYRKAHGLEPATSSFFGGQAEDKAETPGPSSPAAAAEPSAPESQPEPSVTAEVPPEEKRKKFLGIF
ncbi:hypothetical protein F5Y14DRAFT_299847 [Nemania sp. NC0429]|nr:hypothetical protein F5Y14DRAFT_299847 [Nemania sp. NC0429]